MYLVVLALHVIVCVALIGLVLLQRSEGGALGMGGGGSGALMSGRGAADALAKMTQFAGGLFLITSLLLTVIAGAASTSANRSIFDSLPQSTGFRQSAPAPTSPATQPNTPAQPAAPQQQPDPTQSSAPQAAPQNALAAILPGPSPAQAATVPASATGAERAAPLGGQPHPAATPPARSASGATTLPASTNPVRVTTQPTAAPTRAVTTARTQTAGATTQQASGAQPNLVLPQTAGSLALSQSAAQTPESSDPNAVTAVRRQGAAGPDQ